MINHEYRTRFLISFVKELIINSKKETPFEQIQIKNIEEKIETPIQKINIKIPLRVQERKITNIPRKIQRRNILPMQSKPFLRTIVTPETREIQEKKTIAIEPQPTGETLNLGKIDFLLKDPQLIQLECPGPDKLVLVKTPRGLQTTKIILSDTEIQEIINLFSDRAKIPIISGLFKAAVGDYILTAIISETVGNRFIITKISPLSMLMQRSI